MELVKAYALSFLGKPYKFGGATGLDGIDCSGLVIEILKSCGVLPHKFDSTAQGLYDLFESTGTAGIYSLGTLAFYGHSLTKVTHVSFCLDQYRCIEAGSGTSDVIDLQSAIAHNAVVRVRPIKYRADFLVTIKPRYASIGMI